MGTFWELEEFISLIAVRMEGQKFELPEDPSQILPERSSMGPIWKNLFLKLSRIPEKKRSLAAILANICLRNSPGILD